MTKGLRETLPGKHLLPEVQKKSGRSLAHVKAIYFQSYFKAERDGSPTSLLQGTLTRNILFCFACRRYQYKQFIAVTQRV